MSAGHIFVDDNAIPVSKGWIHFAGIKVIFGRKVMAQETPS